MTNNDGDFELSKLDTLRMTTDVLVLGGGPAGNTAATVAALSFATMSAGVRLGRKKAYQPTASKLASPCSSALARFGVVGARFFVKVAMALTRLPSICGIAIARIWHW